MRILLLLLLGGTLSAQTSLTDLYRHLHANPELSFHETETAKRMASELRALDFEVTEGVGGNGVVGVLKNGPGETVLVRCDMDALPLVEQTGRPYASKVTTTDAEGKTVGVMHACGHDVHMTVWVGAARELARRRADWSGTLVFIAQPAEERSGGANAMLADGLYTRFPTPDYALGLHVSAGLPAGTVGYVPGYAMANVDMLDITVFGKGGHGAYPHTTIDPVVISARIIVALQTIVARETSPLEPAVVTVGSIHGGAKGNVIPDEVKLELTLRSYTDEMRNGLIAAVRRVCNGVAMSAGLDSTMYPTVTVRDEFAPALYNNPELTERMAGVFSETIGADNVRKLQSVMGGEDFSRYGRTDDQVPILMFWLGAVEPERHAASERGEVKLPSLHNSGFAPDVDPTLATGVKTMVAGVMNLLEK